MTKTHAALLTVILVCATAAEAMAKSAALASAEKTYKASLVKIDGNHVEALANAVLVYRRKMDAFLARSQRAGDLDATLAAKKEKERYTRTRIIPKEPPADLPTALALAQSDYHNAVAKARIDKHKNVLALVDRYTKYLGSIQKKLVSADKLDEAIEIRKAVEEVEKSAPVTAAKFALADSGITSKDTDTTTKPPKDTADPEYETIEYEKKIGSRGGLMNNWSSTTLRLQKGDKVSIKAAGTWQCTHYSQPLSPVGYAGAVPYRRDPGTNYGALICKNGSKGAARFVGTGTTFTAAKGGGLLYFDANVLPGRTHRRRCSGELRVSVTVKRKKA